MTTTSGRTLFGQAECFTWKPVGLNPRPVSSKPALTASKIQERFLRSEWRLRHRSAWKHAPVLELEETAEKFDWCKYWWPVQLTSNLLTDRPNSIELLDKALVAWKGSGGNWIVLKDECPHRLAPLSEGRVEDDGTLLCSYHAWKFNECGNCVQLPQAKDERSSKTARSNRRSSVQRYPCKVYANMLWVWPDESEQAFEESEKTKIPVPEECDEFLSRKLDAGVRVGYTRVMPYSLEILIENLIDPSHVPVTHHGLIPGMVRTNARPLWMHSTKAMYPQSIASVEYKAHRSDSNRFIELLSPCSIINGEMENGLGSWKGQLMLGSPIRRGKSRLFFFNFPAGTEEKDATWLFKVFGFVEKRFPWLMHLGNHSFVDGDAVFLHGLENNLLSRNQDWNPSIYFMPTSADKMIFSFRTWLMDSASGGPALQKGLVNGQLTPATRRELLDRFSTHTAECKDCQAGLQLIQRVQYLCSLLALVMMLYVVKVGTLWSKQNIFLIAFSAVLVWFRSLLQNKLIPQFEFVDYIHQDKN